MDLEELGERVAGRIGGNGDSGYTSDVDDCVGFGGAEEVEDELLEEGLRHSFGRCPRHSLLASTQLEELIYCKYVPLCACMPLTNRLLTMTGEVAATLAVGHLLKGRVGSYKILEQFTNDRDVWKAM